MGPGIGDLGIGDRGSEMTAHDTIGLLELTSIGVGFKAEDAMLKAASVELLLARSICPGKYLVVVAGTLSEVEASMAAAATAADGSVVGREVISRLRPEVFPALAGAVEAPAEGSRALGVVETFSAASVVTAADAAVKTADVTLFRVHLAMAIGGKGFLLMTGDVPSVEAGVEAAASRAAEDGALVSRIVISAPRPELFRDYQ
jgi:microcompartment protein CcmL/EutN